MPSPTPPPPGSRSDLRMARAATPMAFVRAIVRAYRLRGMDPAPALAQAQIAPALLQQRVGHITAAQMEAV